MENETVYVYATGLSPEMTMKMQRYKEDIESFMMQYPAGAAS